MIVLTLFICHVWCPGQNKRILNLYFEKVSKYWKNELNVLISLYFELFLCHTK
jgi:hypothetical protein